VFIAVFNRVLPVFEQPELKPPPEESGSSDPESAGTPGLA
jgi:hypothetical protein